MFGHQWWPTLAKCEDGVGGGEVGGGDEVLRVGAVHLNPYGFLHAAMETGDLSRGEGDVDDVSLAVVSAKAKTTQGTLFNIATNADHDVDHIGI